MMNAVRQAAIGDVVHVVSRIGSLSDPASLSYQVNAATVRRREPNGLQVQPENGFISFVSHDRIFTDARDAQQAATRMMLDDRAVLRDQLGAINARIFALDGQIAEILPLLDSNEQQYAGHTLSGKRELAGIVTAWDAEPGSSVGEFRIAETANPPSRDAWTPVFRDVRLADPKLQHETGEIAPILVPMRDGSYLAGWMQLAPTQMRSTDWSTNARIALDLRYNDLESAQLGAFAEVDKKIREDARQLGIDADPAEQLDEYVRKGLTDRGLAIIERNEGAARYTGRVMALTDSAVYQDIGRGQVLATPNERARIAIGSELVVGQIVTTVYSNETTDVAMTPVDQEQSVELTL